MKKLNNREFNMYLNRIEEMSKYSHEDYEVEKILADLYYTISQGYIWEFPKMIWREWKIKKFIKLHKKCCDLYF